MDNDSSLVEKPDEFTGLQSLTIEDEESGKSVDFFDMSVEQQQIFVDMLLLVEDAKMLTEKINVAPALKTILQKENLITSSYWKESTSESRNRISPLGLRSLPKRPLMRQPSLKNSYNEFGGGK